MRKILVMLVILILIVKVEVFSTSINIIDCDSMLITTALKQDTYLSPEDVYLYITIKNKTDRILRIQHPNNVDNTFNLELFKIENNKRRLLANSGDNRYTHQTVVGLQPNDTSRTFINLTFSTGYMCRYTTNSIHPTGEYVVKITYDNTIDLGEVQYLVYEPQGKAAEAYELLLKIRNESWAADNISNILQYADELSIKHHDVPFSYLGFIYQIKIYSRLEFKNEEKKLALQAEFIENFPDNPRCRSFINRYIKYKMFDNDESEELMEFIEVNEHTLAGKYIKGSLKSGAWKRAFGIGE